jgi:hypothetical protein
MSEARAMIKYLKRLAELLDALEQAPADQALLLELVGIYLYEQDDPRLALPYVRRLDSASDTVELVRHVPLAARGLAMLSTDDLLVLGRWYAARGIDKDHPNRVAMLTRARLYYEQFLQTYKDRDEVRVQVARDRRQVERNLAELGVGMKEGRRLVKKMRGGDLGAPVNPAIQQAIDRGVAYLYSIVDDETYWDKPNSSDHSFGGYTALAAYALMMADEDPNGRPELRRAIDWLFARPMKGTYALCFRAHLWETLPTDKRQEMVIRKDLGVLRKIGNSRGTYGYYLRRAGRYDISTTLAAMLTFWLGETNGLQGTDPVWTRSVRHLITVQNSDGGWGYNPSDPASAGTKGSMTAAALTILLMAIDQNHLDAEASLKAEADESIARAMEWMDSKFLPDSNPNSGMSNYLYYLATVQHVGLMSGRRTFNGHEWYESAAEHLLKTQHPNGSWGNVADTAFAVVFLARGGNMYESDSGGYFEDEPGPDSMSGPSAANRMGAEAPKTDAATMGAATSRPAIGAQ